MGRPAIDLTGQTFGDLTVSRRVVTAPLNGVVLWRCSCVCGCFVHRSTKALRQSAAHVLNCGCGGTLVALPNLPGERWKDIAEWEGLYAVSNMGRVKSIGRTTMRSNGLRQSIRERILSTNGDGYACVRLAKPGRIKTYQVHVLVATCFCSKPAGSDRVCHRDDMYKNNVHSNLYWGNSSSNTLDCYKNGIKRHLITPSVIARVRRMRASGMILQAIADRVGISKRSVLNIVNGNYRFKEM